MTYIRSQKEEFDAIIKGARLDPRLDPFYKLTNLSIPKDIYIIDDGVSNYRLYGVTRDFENIEVIVEECKNTPKIKVPEFLGFLKGAVIPVGKRIKESPSILKIPGIIFTRDKRIYVRQEIEKIYNLEEVVPSIINDVGRMFCDRNGLYDNIYRDYIKSEI